MKTAANFSRPPREQRKGFNSGGRANPKRGVKLARRKLTVHEQTKKVVRPFFYPRGGTVFFENDFFLSPGFIDLGSAIIEGEKYDFYVVVRENEPAHWCGIKYGDRGDQYFSSVEYVVVPIVFGYVEVGERTPHLEWARRLEAYDTNLFAAVMIQGARIFLKTNARRVERNKETLFAMPKVTDELEGAPKELLCSIINGLVATIKNGGK